MDFILENGQKILSFISIIFFIISFSIIIYLFFGAIPEEKRFYSDKLQQAKEAKDGNGIRLCLDALLALEPDNMQIRYEYALFLENVGKGSEAAPLLEGLASLDEDASGYDEAHWLVGKRMWLSRGSDPNRADLALKHLDKATKLNPRNEIYRADYGAALYEAGNLQEAVKHVLLGVKVRPELAVKVGIASFPKDSKLAADLAQSAESPLLQRFKADPFNEEVCVLLSQILRMRGKADESIGFLQQFLQRKESARVRKELANSIGDQIAQVIQKPPYDQQKVIGLIEQAASIDPNNEFVFGIIERLIAANQEQGQKLVQKLNEMLTKGTSVPMAHFILANVAHSNGKNDQARLHYELAAKESLAIPPFSTNVALYLARKEKPYIPALYNNLAWYFANEVPRDPERALWLVNLALEEKPNQPSFLETRGQIHVLVGKWKEATVDLEKALSLGGPTPAIHQGLSKSYEKLGLKDLAELHKAQAEKTKPITPVPGVFKRRPD